MRFFSLTSHKGEPLGETILSEHQMRDRCLVNKAYDDAFKSGDWNYKLTFRLMPKNCDVFYFIDGWAYATY